MTDEITPELFQHLVLLAALELDPQESEYLRHELNNQLRAVHELEAIPLDESTPVSSHGVPYPPQRTPAIREDTWLPCTNTEEILAQAPELDDGFLIVPEIPHTDLS